MKDTRQLLHLWEFWVALLAPLVIALVLFVVILAQGEFYLDFSHAGFNNVFVFFKLPLSVAALSFPIIALIASNHRSRQTAAQISLNSSQNNFINYFKHREVFFKLIDKLELDFDISFRNPIELYDMLFPDNSPQHVSIHPGRYIPKYSLSEDSDRNMLVIIRDRLLRLLEQSSEIEVEEPIVPVVNGEVSGKVNIAAVEDFYFSLYALTEELGFSVKSGVYLERAAIPKERDAVTKDDKQGIYICDRYVWGHVTLLDNVLKELGRFCQINLEQTYNMSPFWVFSIAANDLLRSYPRISSEAQETKRTS